MPLTASPPTCRISEVDAALAMPGPEHGRLLEAQTLWYLPPGMIAIGSGFLSHRCCSFDLPSASWTDEGWLVRSHPPDVCRTQDWRPVGAVMRGCMVLNRLFAQLPIVPAELAEPVAPWTVGQSRSEEPLPITVWAGRRNERSSPELIHLGLPSDLRPGLHLSPDARERHNGSVLSCAAADAASEQCTERLAAASA